MSVTRAEASRQLKFNADVSFNSKKIMNLADPVNAQDAATKNYVDNMSIGLDVKRSVRCASTADLIGLTGLLTIDGITVVAGDRVLVKDDVQGDSRNNGIYVAASGAWTRATDFAGGMHVGGSFVFVEIITVNGDNGFVCTSNNGASDLVGDAASSIDFAQFSGAGQIIAGTGISKSGNTISLASGVCSPGTYTKVTVDTYGRVTSATSITATDLPSGIDAAKIGGGVVDNTEFGYLNGVTSAIQTQLNAKEATLTKGNLTESTSAVLTITGGTGAIIGTGLSIQVKAASSTVSGYLSTTDWNTFNNKQPAITGAATTITASNLTVSKALVSDASGKVAAATTSAAELGYLVGVTSAIQTQLNAKEGTLTKGNLTEATSSVLTITGGTGAIIGSGLSIQVKAASTSVSGYLSNTDWNTFNGKQNAITGGATTILSSNLTANFALISDGSGKVAVSSISTTVLGYLSGVTSAIQTQINTKLTAANYIVRETPSGLLNGSNIAYTLAHTPTSGKEMVFLNGVLQNAGGGNDYTITGATITMLTAPLSDDLLLVTYTY